MKNPKNKDEEMIKLANFYLDYILGQIEADIDENNIFLNYAAFKWTIGVLEAIDWNLKKIKNHSEEKEKIYSSIKSIEPIININKEYYDGWIEE